MQCPQWLSPERVAEDHLRGRYGLALEVVERWTLLDSIDGAVERLSEYRAVGVSENLPLTLGRVRTR